MAIAARAHVQGPPTGLALAHEDLVARIHSKIAAGEVTPEALAEEFAEMEAVFAARKSEEAHDAGDLLVSQLAFTIELLDEPAQVGALMGRIEAEFPEADSGSAIVQALERLFPSAVINEVVPLGNQIVNRAAVFGLTERHAAVHAARALCF